MLEVKSVFPRGLIVSCQALEHEPLHGSEIMARMAQAAQMSGAVGIRANTPQDIRAIRAAVALPVIGIYKQVHEGCDVFITPTFETAREIAEAGSTMIATDATARPRPRGEKLADLIARIHGELGLPVMADCSTAQEALEAARLGVDVVSSTLSGYTAYSPKTADPDFAMLEILVRDAGVPVIAEGRFHHPDQVARALEMGCHAVVVGGAITRPQEITKRFTDRIASLLGGGR
jgi:N-acylglucosamine-6-phosphate 2-epimerase